MRGAFSAWSSGSRRRLRGLTGYGIFHAWFALPESPRWLADRGRPARQPDGRQVSSAMGIVKVSDEELATPHRAIRPESGAVERHADDRAIRRVVREA